MLIFLFGGDKSNRKKREGGNIINLVTLVGRLVDEPKFIKDNDGKPKATIKISMPSDYKNEDGIYETDFAECTLTDSVAIKVADYCKKGDVLGIKGKIKSSTHENANGKLELIHEIKAFRVEFISATVDKDESKETKKQQEKIL